MTKKKYDLSSEEGHAVFNKDLFGGYAVDDVVSNGSNQSISEIQPMATVLPTNSFLLIPQKNKDILAYEPEVWRSADVLRSSVGLKNSEFPDFMMPFFALRMVESRLVREYARISQDVELTSETDRIDELKDTAGFYNSMIIERKILLSDIVQNDKTFYTEFNDYLNAFDVDLKNLLGIVNPDKTENLNLAGCVESLKKKDALFGYVAAWSEIDFRPYDNSEITTLEEHIKRKWADMSAETAGEQYTPDDIINLISELISTWEYSSDKIYKIYDMTCGGGNMLFGVEDKLKAINSNIKTATLGQELRGSLFALAKIESKFRTDSKIEHGNTLINDKFDGEYLDLGVANPPYGVSWKDEQKKIEADQTGRFIAGKPAISDGQLLFVQHMLSKLNSTGKAYIVLNGSPLFAGDAGSGESNIRKWILDNDYLEALIQLPNNEFFNTGITTYIWCLNKKKTEDRKDKILCINADQTFVKLKKNKGSKSNEISKDQAKELATIFKNFTVTPISKILSKFDFYFNKQKIEKLEFDEEFGSLQENIKLNNVSSICIGSRENETILDVIINVKNLIHTKENADQVNQAIKDFDHEEQSLTVNCSDGVSYSLDENHCIIKTVDGAIQNLGYGVIKVKVLYKKSKGKISENVSIEVSCESVWSRDDEKVRHLPEKECNDKLISDFMAEWVSQNTQCYKLLDNIVGVEINFNSVFPKKIEIRSTDVILKELSLIDDTLRSIQ